MHRLGSTKNKQTNKQKQQQQQNNTLHTQNEETPTTYYHYFYQSFRRPYVINLFCSVMELFPTLRSGVSCFI
jgi:hypothetical protein